MSRDIVTCPWCGFPDAELEVEEVDIGVGIQEHIMGCECPNCGRIALSSCCGVWETKDGKYPHKKWCHELD